VITAPVRDKAWGEAWQGGDVEPEEGPESVGDGRVVVAVDAEDTPWCSTGVELVSDRLFSLGASAVSELAGDGGRLRLVADLPARALDRLDGPYEVLEHDPSWNDAWRDHATAVAVGDRLLLRPEWVTADPADVGRVEIVLDAAHAFGSGSHPTTRLCLEALEGLADELAGARVLDVGSGTGVLGVAALVLGAGSLVAVDVDPAAVAATGRTAGLNGVSEWVVEVSSRLVAEVTVDHGAFDVVLANLLIPIIETLGPELAAAVAPGGRLILSGLLADPSTGQVERALVAIGVNFGASNELDRDGWAAVVAV